MSRQKNVLSLFPCPMACFFFHSDIQFLIGPSRKKIFAHRCILSGRCEVFRAMFVDHTQKNGPIEKDVPFVLSDMVSEVFLTMLEFIYTNSVTLSAKVVSNN